MALRPFLLPKQPPPPAPARGEERTRAVGGSIEKRRAHGTPSVLNGRFVFDPVFRDADMEALRAFCDPTDARPLVVEIGFQRGRFARAFCLEHPQSRYLGFEVRSTFCNDADAWLAREDVQNARLALVDAREAMAALITPGTLDALFAFFPDPWWKSKHMKKRLMTRTFAAEAAALLRDGGRLLLKTDVEGYADWAQEEMTAVAELEVRRLDDRSAGLPPTQRERRCALRGLPTWAIEGVRRPRGAA